MQIIPVIASVASAALSAGSIGTAIVGGLVSVGAGYLARRLAPQAKTGQSASTGTQLTLQLEANENRKLALGRVASAGSLKYHNVYGPNGADYLQLVFVLADHECDGLEKAYVDGVEVTLGTVQSTPWVSGRRVVEYPNCLWLEFHSGAWDQTADADLVDFAPEDGWPSTNRGRGICYVRATLKYSAKHFSNGVPQFVFVYRGAKLYDRRKDSTAGGVGAHRWIDPATFEWSDNSTLCLENYMRGVHVNGVRLAGMSTPVTSLPVSVWMAGANACDELVALKAGGTEKRYRMGALIDVSTPHREVIRNILASMAGSLIESGGVFRPQVGVAQVPVMTITDEDIVSGNIQYVPKLSRSDLVNAVFGAFSDPSRMFESTALPPRISLEDRASDGGDLLSEHYDFPFIQSGTQGQRALEIIRRKVRHQDRLSLPLSSRAFVLEAGDWITVSLDSQGIEGATFEVLQATPQRDLSVRVDLAAISSTVFAFNPAVDELDPLNPTPVGSGGSTFTTIANFQLFAEVLPGSGDQQTPCLRATWNAITDETVSSLLIEYRRLGDVVALGTTVIDPTVTEFFWSEGVQGGLIYEARVRPVTLPDRAVSWTGWVSTAGASPQQVVGAAAVANTVPDGSITPIKLDDYTRRTIELMIAKAIVQGSLASFKQQVQEDLARLSEAVLDLQSQAISQNAYIQRREIIQQSQNSAFAEAIQLVGTQLGDLSANVAVVQGSIDGIKAYYGVLVDVNGRFGFFKLDGTGDEITAVFGLDRFQIIGTGTDPTAPFTVITVEGQEVVIINAPLYGTGTITGDKLSANTIDGTKIVAGVELVAPKLRNEANTSYWDLDSGDFQIG